jgi:hypothetical protein
LCSISRILTLPALCSEGSFSKYSSCTCFLIANALVLNSMIRLLNVPILWFHVVSCPYQYLLEKFWEELVG